jgi:hypothetical protein
MNRLLGLTAALMLFVATNAASAPSQDECAIWICLPGGFPSGCGDAKSAMRDRIRDRKPPLPRFSSCAENPPRGSGSHMSFDHGIAAYIPTHRECASWDTSDGGCLRYHTVEEQYIRGRRCESDGEDYRNPPFCAKTVRWSEVFIEDELAGPTYYWE